MHAKKPIMLMNNPMIKANVSPKSKPFDAFTKLTLAKKAKKRYKNIF